MYTFKDLTILLWSHKELTIETDKGDIPELLVSDIPEFIALLQRVYTACQQVEKKIKDKESNNE